MNVCIAVSNDARLGLTVPVVVQTRLRLIQTPANVRVAPVS